MSALHRADGAALIAAQYFQARWPRSVSTDLITKSAQDAGTTADPSWAHPLFQKRPLADSFVDLLRLHTLIGRSRICVASRASVDTQIRPLIDTSKPAIN